jgi:hypothetical protein
MDKHKAVSKEYSVEDDRDASDESDGSPVITPRKPKGPPLPEPRRPSVPLKKNGTVSNTFIMYC